MSRGRQLANLRSLWQPCLIWEFPAVIWAKPVVFLCSYSEEWRCACARLSISWPLIGCTKFATHLLRCGLVARWRHYTRGYWGLLIHHNHILAVISGVFGDFRGVFKVPFHPFKVKIWSWVTNDWTFFGPLWTKCENFKKFRWLEVPQNSFSKPLLFSI